MEIRSFPGWIIEINKEIHVNVIERSEGQMLVYKMTDIHKLKI